jgi:hypothetical protein
MPSFNTHLSPLVTALALLVCNTAALGVETTKQAIAVEAFHSIVLTTAGDLHVIEGASDALVIEAEPSVIDRLRARVSAGVLYLESAGEPIFTDQPIRFHVTARRVSRVEGRSAGRITLAGLTGPSFVLDVSGAHHVSGTQMRTDALEVNLRGSGKVALEGSVQRQTIVIAGSGAYLSPHLPSGEATVNITGSGNAVVSVARQLHAALSGSGGVRFLGSPVVHAQISGAGSVKPMPQL